MTEITGTKIAAAFLKAQADMGNATKDSTNPFFKNKYADLNAVREACLPVLNMNGISVLQPIVQIDGKNFVKTILLHESGETIESFTEILFAKQNDPQAQGSGITYARRYGLQSLVCIGAEDDDGNKAAEKPKDRPVAKALAESADAEMKKTLDKKNEQDFAGLKSIIENCGSLEELTKERNNKENIRIVNSLKKWRPELAAKLAEAVKFMEKELSVDPAMEEAQLLTDRDRE